MIETIEQKLSRGVRIHNLGRFAEAEQIYREVLAVQPNHADALNLLGVIASQSNHPNEALDLVRRAIAINPVPDYHRNLGLILASMGRFAEAADAQRTCVAGNPQSFDAWFALGNSLAALDNPREAVTAYERCLRLRPDDPLALAGMGITLYQSGDPAAALRRLDRAIQQAPDLATARCNRGLILLSQGNFEEGWREFDWRWKMPEMTARQTAFLKPRWRGADLKGLRILLHGERGGGDTLNLARYIPLVSQRGGRVFFSCQPELQSLMKQVPGIEGFLDAPVQPRDFDLHCSLMDLPAVFQTNLTNIPPQTLVADPQAAAKWKERMPADQRVKVGLVWAGKPQPPGRSIRLELLKGLGTLPNVWLCSLQKGNGIEELAALSPEMKITDWTDELKDFSDTAALISNLDLIITVDTSVAHLAGAMGKRVWILLKLVPDFRWMLEGSETPWYPTARLFRQKTLADWSAPATELLEAARALQ